MDSGLWRSTVLYEEGKEKRDDLVRKFFSLLQLRFRILAGAGNQRVVFSFFGCILFLLSYMYVRS